MSTYIGSFTVIPKELFRTNNGTSIVLRDRAMKPTGSYDLLTEAGKVKPKALDPATYADTTPNGASMRPNTRTQNSLVKTFHGSNIVIFAIPQGTQIPDGLILVHGFADHYSLQAAKEMTLQELNKRVTDFMNTAGQRLTKEQWFQKYPEPTESS
ncbi:hypothetical protein MMC30_006930 [Trapelia coarctata]|nr:hypothetical protein [Trapelia coarctata]